MAGVPLSFIPYPPIQRLGVIGDRKTAALIAAELQNMLVAASLRGWRT